MSRERERFEEIGKKLRRDSDAFCPLDQGQGRRHMLAPPGALNTVTPCAACKLLRRRCAQECPFSPYFSPHEPQKFASVHKVFGASNVSKMLLEVPESQRADAANSLVYEANVRLRDPIYGCMGAISTLQQQVQLLQEELNAVRAEVLKYKYRETRSTTTSHVTWLSSGDVSISAPSSSPHRLLPPAPPPSSSIYTPVASSTGAELSNTITNNHQNIDYFG